MAGTSRLARAGAALAAAAAAGPAAAHHFMDGDTPTTGFEGLLSGVAHPVIGVDHLLFLLAAALLLARWRLPARLVLAGLFAAAALLGTGAHLAGANLPVPETLVALTLLAAAALLALGRALPGAVLAAGLALAGCLHGYVYAEAVVGAEPAPLVAYLAGFTLVQLALLAGLAGAARSLAPRLGARLGPRVGRGLRPLCAALVAAGGLGFLALSLVP